MARGSTAPPFCSGARLVAAGAILLAACEFPTSPPQWESDWVVPGDSVVMSVSSLLPSSVTVTEDESAFVLALDPTNFGRTLGQVCAACQTLDGLTAPKPAFSATFGDVISLPSEVVSASLAAGSLRIELTNGLNFDPIRPSSSARGSLKVTVTNDGTLVAADSLDGNVDDFPSDSMRVLTLDLVPGTITGAIQVDLEIDSPEGDPVQIDASQSFAVAAIPGDIYISDVEVAVSDKSIDVEPVELDLEDVDSEMVSRIRGGAFRLSIENPFAVEGGLDLSLVTALADLRKGIPVAQGSSSPRVEFEGHELRSIVGHTVSFGGSGVVSAPSGTVTVTPSQELVIAADLELVLGPKEE